VSVAGKVALLGCLTTVFGVAMSAGGRLEVEVQPTAEPPWLGQPTSARSSTPE